MLNHTLRVHGEKFADKIPMPVNKTEALTTIIRCGACMSGLEVVIIADTAVTVTAGKAVTLTLQHANEDMAFTDVDSRISHACPAGANTFKAGDVIARMTLPMDCKQYVKASLGTNDTAPTGTVSVVPGLLPR